MKKLSYFTFAFLILFNYAFSAIHPTKLTCEYLENPAVVDVSQPRLAWVNIAGQGERGQVQTAWQVRAASSKDRLDNPDLWDSQKMEGNNSTRVKYNGKKLTSRQNCWWQVRVWDKDGKASPWSEPAFWRMGLLEEQDWKAAWIGAPWQGEEALPKPPNPRGELESFPPPAPLLRKNFQVKKEITQAVIFVTGLGYFELYLNGEKVGDDVLVPNQTNYGKRPTLMNQNIPVEDNFRGYRVMYLAYDLKDKLKQGTNAIGAILGNGFYNPAKYWAEGYGTPRFIAQLYLTYSDGTEEIIVSDNSWKVSESPILMDMVYYGEHYDARKEQPGWCTPGFNDAAWKNAVIRKAPEGKLVAHTANPDKVTERLKPVKFEKSENGSYLIDFGEEVTGWVKLSDIEAQAGHKIEMKCLKNSPSGDNSYICSGKGKETYAPRFNWFVFREVEIVNWPGVLTPEQVTAEVVHTLVPESAVFETSNLLFNQINKIWKRSQTDNMHGGIASDCPHRERAPYTGDGQVASVTVMHNFDSKSFYHKWIHDIIDAQNVETGYIPNGAPWEPGCGGGVGWGAAICVMPWEFYLHFGSTDILEDAYPAMKEYIRYMQDWVDEDGIMFSQRTGNDGQVLRWFNLGEWNAPGKLPPDEMVHTFYFWRCALLTSLSAKALGKTEEAAKYARLAESTKQAFHKRFYDPEKGSYGPYGGNVFALKMGVPGDQYDKVVKALKENIEANDGHLDTGIFGTKFFFEVLAENGLNELAYEAMNKKTFPAYGYWLETGATTTRESWRAATIGNHPMFGGGLVWLYRKLAGMNADPDDPGYRHIIFRPQPAGDISFARYHNHTPYGETGIFWEKKNGRYSMEITVPVGCHATVYVPATESQTILESGKKITDSEFIQNAGRENGYRIFKVSSGKYLFEV